MNRLVAAISLAFILTAAAFAQGGKAAKAPSVSLRDLGGKTVRLRDFRGKVVLLNFWATWCVPCAAETPELVKWQADTRTGYR